MNVAIWLLTAVLALPLAEIVTFVLVAAWIGFSWAALAVVVTSLIGAAMLRLGGARVASLRLVVGQARLTALEADNGGTFYILAAILLLIPGFITDAIGVVLLLPPARRLAGALLRRGFSGAATKHRNDVVDLDMQEWRRLPDPALARHPDREPEEQSDR